MVDVVGVLLALGPRRDLGVVRRVALVLNHPLHPKVVLDKLVDVDVAEALGHVDGPLLLGRGAGGALGQVGGRRLLLGQRALKDRARAGAGTRRRGVGGGHDAAGKENGLAGVVRGHDRLPGGGGGRLVAVVRGGEGVVVGGDGGGGDVLDRELVVWVGGGQVVGGVGISRPLLLKVRAGPVEALVAHHVRRDAHPLHHGDLLLVALVAECLPELGGRGVPVGPHPVLLARPSLGVELVGHGAGGHAPGEAAVGPQSDVVGVEGETGVHGPLGEALDEAVGGGSGVGSAPSQQVNRLLGATAAFAVVNFP